MRSPTWRGLTLKYPIHARFIELMPLNGDTDGSRFRSLFISGKEILDRAQAELGDLKPIEKEDPAAPADEFQVRRRSRNLRRNNAGERTVLRPRCSRLRLTADGKIHPCLLTDLDVPVKDAIRSEDPIPAIHEVLWHTAGDKAGCGPHVARRVEEPDDEPDRGLSSLFLADVYDNLQSRTGIYVVS